jgi:hypothetical protein
MHDAQRELSPSPFLPRTRGREQTEHAEAILTKGMRVMTDTAAPSSVWKWSD